MTASRAAGSFLYDDGHRLCVFATSGGTFRKTDLQGAFNEFGHIVQIETPKSGLAFIAFKDRADAAEALDCMDRKSVNGVQVTVSWAGPKPTSGLRSNFNNGETPASERPAFGARREVLTTTSFERDMGVYSGRRPATRRQGRNNSRSTSLRRDMCSRSERRVRSRSRRRCQSNS
mmetsp:Transcript_7455/g.17669  ORF Transcript_7455/g.17669 Transcript_7455/m.17669 type:complete len:175 (+) Transcript_7455:63-587(+)